MRLLSKFRDILNHHRSIIKKTMEENEYSEEILQFRKGQLDAYNLAILDLETMIKCAEEHEKQFKYNGI